MSACPYSSAPRWASWGADRSKGGGPGGAGCAAALALSRVRLKPAMERLRNIFCLLALNQKTFK
jgi:hypothetical protein